MVCSNCGHKGLTSGNSRFDSALHMEQDREDRRRAIGELRAKKKSLSHSDKNKRKGIPDKPEKTLTRHLRFNLSNIYRSKTREGGLIYLISIEAKPERGINTIPEAVIAYRKMKTLETNQTLTNVSHKMLNQESKTS